MTSVQKSQVLAVLCAQVAFAGAAVAANPPAFDKTQAVAGPRADPGTGLCGTVTHFLAAQPLSQKAEAAALADKPTTDPMVLDRTSRLFGTINLRNGQPNTGGDFTGATYPDAVLPYSKDAAATPMGTDSNLIVRLRGYLNIPAALTGKIISFGVNCDDFCSLQIANTTVVPMADERISARVIRQVGFKDPGLYPVELLYYQNGSTAFLEWSRTDTAVQECPNDICLTSLTDPGMYQTSFKLLTAAELYSSVAGASSACKECGTAGTSCAAGSFCGEGLCQQCNTPDHCGASCQACPATARTCSASGQCVECTADAQCGSGSSCEIASGKCKVPPGTDNPNYSGGSGCSVSPGGVAAAGRLGGSFAVGTLLALGLLARRRRERGRQPV